MGLRPARCYKEWKRPWTRQSRSRPRKGYVKGVPDKKIHKFEMGNAKKEFPLAMNLVAVNRVQIRHNALESARVMAHKHLTKVLGEENYFMKILVYPHNVMRENALATGAGADRFQSGMRLAFGRPIGVAARVKENQAIIMVRTDTAKVAVVKEAMRRAASKLPTPCRVVVVGQIVA